MGSRILDNRNMIILEAIREKSSKDQAVVGLAFKKIRRGLKKRAPTL